MPRCPLFGRYPGESGHNSDIVKPTRLTQSGQSLQTLRLKAAIVQASRPRMGQVAIAEIGSPIGGPMRRFTAALPVLTRLLLVFASITSTQAASQPPHVVVLCSACT